jgi:hypothetical protein
VSTRGPSPRLARGDQRLADSFSATRGRFTAHAMLQRAGHSSIRFARSRRRQPTLPALLCPLLLSLRSAGQLACVASLFIYLSSSLRTADYSMRLSCRAASELGRCDVLDGLRRNTYSKGSSLNRCNLSAKSSAASTELLSKALRCSEGSARRQTTPLCRVPEQSPNLRRGVNRFVSQSGGLRILSVSTLR